MNMYREEQTGEGLFCDPQYNLSLSICIQNMNFVLYSCGDIFDEKYGEKEKRTNTGKNK